LIILVSIGNEEAFVMVRDLNRGFLVLVQIGFCIASKAIREGNCSLKKNHDSSIWNRIIDSIVLQKSLSGFLTDYTFLSFGCASGSEDNASNFLFNFEI
jgi:hypothetical protein